MSDLQKIAVVIDADNTRLSKVADVLREVSTRGRIVVKRAYGNWRKEALKNWESEIKRLGIKAEQQFDYVSGKNATDMALVIDTIELLYTNIYDAFVIVSSDSDYTPLAIKLHESGVYVMGVGEMTTPVSFRNACDEFLFLENISAAPVAVETPEPVEEASPPAAAGKKATGSAQTKKSGKAAAEGKKQSQKAGGGAAQDAGEDSGEDGGIEEIHALLRKAYDTYQDDDGYANVGSAGDFLKRTKPDFDCRTYGCTKLTQLLAAFPEQYEMRRSPGKGNAMIVDYRCISKKKSSSRKK